MNDIDFVIVDLEATCWGDVADKTMPYLNEIIQIGAVACDRNFNIISKFSSYVKPVYNPTLSDFCKKLTGIRQDLVDDAPRLEKALQYYSNWLGGKSYDWGSWGNFDNRCMIKNCTEFYNIPESLKVFGMHFNLKWEYQELTKLRRPGLIRALRNEGLNFVGNHHDALDDAINIVRVWKSRTEKIEKSLTVLLEKLEK